MRKHTFIRWSLSAILACLLVASVSLPVRSALADETTETPQPASTEIPTETPITESKTEASPTQTVTAESIAATATITNTVTAAPILRGNYVADEVLVRFKNSASDEDIAECLRQIHGEIQSTIDEIRVTVIEIESINVSNAVATLSACPAVRYVEPNYIAYVMDTFPTDSSFGLQYGLVNIRAPQGWDYATGSMAITIAVLDTGVDLSHTDLAAKIVPGHDFVNNDTVPQDDHGHGTHVAGITAAVTNNANGVAGVSWGARIMPVKVLNSAGGGTFANMAAGITWAVDNGAQVLNISVGASSSSIVLQNAINYAVSQGAIVIAASGNSASPVLYPAAYPNVIAVGATDSLNNLAGTSNYGPEMDLVAPGVNIYSTEPGGYGYRGGTSMSAAYVSGFAALLRGIPGNSASSVRSIMEGTALDLGSAGWDQYYGSGLIQMDTAILQAWPAASGNNNAPTAFIFQPGGYIPTATFTPNVTSTITSTVPSASLNETPTLTLQPDENGTGDLDTPTPELMIQATETPQAGAGGNWYIPLCALLFILIGVLLFWFGSRRRWRSYSGLHF
jgi:thermitase